MPRSFLIAATTAPCVANPDPLAPLSTPGLRLLVNCLHSRSLVIKSRVCSCIFSHLPAFSAMFSAAARSVSAADAVAADVDAAQPQHLLCGLARDALPAHALYLYLCLATAGNPSLRPDNFTYSFAFSAFFAGGGFPIPVISGFQGDATKLFDGMSEQPLFYLHSWKFETENTLMILLGDCDIF